jgi:hypothetical protein
LFLKLMFQNQGMCFSTPTFSPANCRSCSKMFIWQLLLPSLEYFCAPKWTLKIQLRRMGRIA